MEKHWISVLLIEFIKFLGKKTTQKTAIKTGPARVEEKAE